MAEIHLPFPPASLSGHNTGHWRAKSAIVAKHRHWARVATQGIHVPDFGDGDIMLTISFIPPDNRGDRVNFPNRMKPYIDGIAEQLGVNDKRFIPRFFFAPAQKPGQVHVQIGGNQAQHPYSTRRVVK